MKTIKNFFLLLLLFVIPFITFSQDVSLYLKGGYSKLGIFGVETVINNWSTEVGYQFARCYDEPISDLEPNSKMRHSIGVGISRYLYSDKHSPYITVGYTYNGMVERYNIGNYTDPYISNMTTFLIGYRFINKDISIKHAIGYQISNKSNFTIEFTIGLKIYSNLKKFSRF